MPATNQEPKRNHKRLILLCDGTWQNAESDPEKRQPPTNIIRLARAIKPEAEIFEKDEHGNTVKKVVDQVVYYQSGVGTGKLDRLVGGAFGMGLSEKVRSAYAFLANNYVEGDKIYIFGFSRGAFTARSVAGLITKMGLLDKRGMDNFSVVYKEYYKTRRDLTEDEESKRFRDARDRFGLERPPLGTIEAIGVFDTVGFHRPLTGKLEWLNLFLGEQYEFRNTELPTGINHAFQALSLDEERFAFKPLLWYEPKGKRAYKTDLKQVWFSGEHSDIGGGKKDSRLSNISLGWMISEFTKNNLLDFDPDYLLEQDNRNLDSYPNLSWATSQGEGGKWWEGQNKLLRILSAITFFFIGLLIDTAQFFAFQHFLGLRTPGIDHKEGFITHEFLHSSIRDRDLRRSVKKLHEKSWPSRALRYWKPALADEVKHGNRVWKKRINGEVFTLEETPIDDIERRCKNNIRDANPEKALEFKFVKRSQKYAPFAVPPNAAKNTKKESNGVSNHEPLSVNELLQQTQPTHRLHHILK